MEELTGKLTLEEYEALGKALKDSYKSLKLIRKILLKIDYEAVLDSSEDEFVEHLGLVLCDLTNLRYEFENETDKDFPNDALKTIDFFN